MTNGRKEVANKLALRGEFMPQQALIQIESLVAKLKDSKALPPSITNGAQMMMVFLAGYEAGMTPMQSLSSYYIVNGRVTIFGDAVLRQLKQAGFSVEWGEMSKEVATVTIIDDKKRRHTESFTFVEAQEAGLTNKDNWKKYPKDMLRWKALGRAVRFFCPEVLGGHYIKEEADDFDGIEIKATVVDNAPETTDAPQGEPDGYDEAVRVWENYGEISGWSESQAYGVLGKTLMKYYGKEKLNELNAEEIADFTTRIRDAKEKLTKKPEDTAAPETEQSTNEEKPMTQETFAEGLGAKVDTNESK